MQVGGGLSSVPRIARDLGVFVPKEEAVEVLAALLDAWKEDLRYRVSRVKSRMKFMVDDYGADGIRTEVERRLGGRLADYELEPPSALADHIGVHPQREAGLFYVGAPVHIGLVSGDQMVTLADLAEDLGGDVRLTRQQNFVLTGVPEARLDEVAATLGELGFPLDVNRVRASAIACMPAPPQRQPPNMFRRNRKWHKQTSKGDSLAGYPASFFPASRKVSGLLSQPSATAAR